MTVSKMPRGTQVQKKNPKKPATKTAAAKDNPYKKEYKTSKHKPLTREEVSCNDPIAYR